jgi:hypothetical protein
MKVGVLLGLVLALGALACRMARDNEREQPMGPSTAMSGGAAAGKPSAAPRVPKDSGGATGTPEAGRAGDL